MLRQLTQKRRQVAALHTKPVGIVNACVALCVISIVGVFAQEQRNRFAQPVRTFHTAAEFAQLTGGRVNLIRSTSLTFPDGSTLTGSQAGIVMQKVSEPP